MVLWQYPDLTVRQFCTDDRRSTDAKGGNTMKSLFRVALVFAALVAFAAPASAQSIQADPPAMLGLGGCLCFSFLFSS